MSSQWHKTACMLCSVNCGVEIKLDGRRIVRVRGDKDDPASKGYTCEKALRIDHYQNGRDRLTSPLRRRPDGTYEEIDWDTAIAEVALGFASIRDEHGGDKILYYGGGSQGNHLGGGYGAATRRAIGSIYSSNALAQEKTGEFWVDGELFGSLGCHTCPDMEHTACGVFWGKNPWQSHGIPRARVVLKEMAADPLRKLIVVDPRRSETADLADHFLQLKPGTDAWLLGAMLRILFDEDLVDRRWLAEHAHDVDEIEQMLSVVEVDSWIARTGLTTREVMAAAKALGESESVSIFEDLGIQMSPHSTLNSWLEKLIFLVTGNFAKRGGMNLHSRFAALAGDSKKGSRGPTSPVGGHRIIGGLIPCNVIPDEILTDHPDRFRGALIESGNPVHSLADSQRFREAFEALEFLVVIDVAFTETARLADYILPAASQYEKWEAAFFTMEFPDNDFNLRAPVLAPLGDSLPEPEIHRRLCRALGAYTDADIADLRAAAETGRAGFGEALFGTLAEKPHLGAFLPLVLMETLGATLGEGNESAAAVWGLAQRLALSESDSIRRAGYEGDGMALGDALFDAIVDTPHGIVFTSDPYEQTWERMANADHRVTLMIGELVDEFRSLADEMPVADTDYPYVLSAGERRSGTANNAIRDPGWRRKNPGTALRISPDDAAELGVGDGGKVRLTTRRGEVVTVVEVSDTMQPGHISLPNGQGLDYPDVSSDVEIGVSPNELTSSHERDPIAGTPHHKHVAARLEAVG